MRCRSMHVLFSGMLFAGLQPHCVQLKWLSTQSHRGNTEINNSQVPKVLFLLWQNIKNKYLMSTDPIEQRKIFIFS